MRLYCNKCTKTLTVPLEITLMALAEFDLSENLENVSLTRYHIQTVLKGSERFINKKEISLLLCRGCGNNVKIDDALFKCDECGDYFPKNDHVNVGGIILCRGCVTGQKIFEDFNVFGKRGPSKSSREKHLQESIEDARRIVEESRGEVDVFDRATIEAVSSDEEIIVTNEPAQNARPASSDAFTNAVSWTAQYIVNNDTSSGNSN